MLEFLYHLSISCRQKLLEKIEILLFNNESMILPSTIDCYTRLLYISTGK